MLVKDPQPSGKPAVPADGPVSARGGIPGVAGASAPQPRQKQRTVRFRLTLLVLACVLPVFVIAGLLISYAYHQKQHLIERQVLETTRALSMVVDQHFAAIQAAATALATSPALASGDFATFYKQVKQVQQDNPGWGDVNLADSTGQQYINSYVPFGSPLPKRHVSDVMRRVFEGKPGIANLFKGALTGRNVFAVETPVFINGQVKYDLVFAVPAELLTTMLSRQLIPPDWSAAIWDANETVVTRNRFPERYVGHPGNPVMVKRMAEGVFEGTIEGSGQEGPALFMAFSRSTTTGWAVTIGVPKAVLLADVQQWLWWTVGGGLLLSSLGIALALFLARQITGSIHALVGPALALGSGEPVNIGPLDLAEANELGHSLIRTSHLLQQRTAEREELLQALQRQAELQRISFDAIIVWRLGAGVPSEPASGSPGQGIESWNVGAEQLYGYSESEALGRVTHELLQSVHPKPWPEIELELRANGFWEGEIRHRTKDGREIIVWARKRLLRGDDGVERVLEANRDITAHRQAEQRVAHLASFPELNPNPIFEAGPDGKISYANPAARKLFPHLFEDGASHPLLTELASVIAEFTTHPEQVIVREVEADGRTFLQTIHCRPELRRVRAYFTDITDRKRAEAQLWETNERLRLFIEYAPVALAMFDREMRYLHVSRHWCTAYNLGDRDLRGLSHYEVFPEISDEWKQAHRRALAGEVLRSQGDRFQRADGSMQWVRWEIRPWHDATGAVGGIVIFSEDITESKRAEEALRQSEERWATTLRSIGDAVISTCAQGKVIFMNDVAQALTGWTLAEAQGKHLETVFNIVNEVTREKPENPVDKVRRLGQIVGLANHTALISRNGTEYPIEDSAAPIRDQDGTTTGVVLVFHDVTDKRKAEQALRQSDRLATAGRLAATLAHEIHNPLDTVGNLLFLINQVPELETARQYAAMASDEVARVTQMTRHMLAFQRESSKPVAVNISEVIDGAIALFDRKIQSANLHVQKQVCFEQTFLGLTSEIRQVLVNLIGNAIEAVGQDGKISLRAHGCHNWHSGQRGLRVTVADNGPGIPAAIRGRIFEPFFTTKGEAGTGLGLWITSGIIEKCGGTLRLRSVTRPGRSGTSFSVFLPIED